MSNESSNPKAWAMTPVESNSFFVIQSLRAAAHGLKRADVVKMQCIRFDHPPSHWPYSFTLEMNWERKRENFIKPVAIGHRLRHPESSFNGCAQRSVVNPRSGFSRFMTNLLFFHFKHTWDHVDCNVVVIQHLFVWRRIWCSHIGAWSKIAF